ncbi:DUF4913 domain-containing protein [Streptomyces sp. NPDC017448]|uniref:DUF4913 domain-containing protein n=1 Tax=Streptomyces sp. NPDC017448 TaxID=3364996 RepID=UPI0037AAA460
MRSTELEPEPELVKRAPRPPARIPCHPGRHGTLGARPRRPGRAVQDPQPGIGRRARPGRPLSARPRPDENLTDPATCGYTGTSGWHRGHLDPVLRELRGSGGPFAGCDKGEHRVEHRLPGSAPRAWRPADRS